MNFIPGKRFTTQLKKALISILAVFSFPNRTITHLNKFANKPRKAITLMYFLFIVSFFAITTLFIIGVHIYIQHWRGYGKRNYETSFGSVVRRISKGTPLHCPHSYTDCSHIQKNFCGYPVLPNITPGYCTTSSPINIYNTVLSFGSTAALFGLNYLFSNEKLQTVYKI